MIRNAPCRRVLLFVVIALVGLMAAPIDECDEYAFIHSRAAPAHANVSPDDAAGPDHQHACTCIVCVLITDDSFVPRLPAPQRGEGVAIAPPVLCSSTFLPGIFHPPIA